MTGKWILAGLAIAITACGAARTDEASTAPSLDAVTASSHADPGCGSKVIRRGDGFRVAPSGGDDTAALQCVLDAAAAAGRPVDRPAGGRHLRHRTAARDRLPRHRCAGRRRARRCCSTQRRRSWSRRSSSPTNRARPTSGPGCSCSSGATSRSPISPSVFAARRRPRGGRSSAWSSPTTRSGSTWRPTAVRPTLPSSGWR